VLEKKYCVD